MSYQVFARKYRPLRFEEIVGQEHVTRTLTQGLRNDRLAHAYIFSGPRGIGKTTTARLLAMSVNCENRDPGDSEVEPCNECDSCRQIRESRDVDVVEIDGASNNSVDQVRELRENARYAPTRGRRKVYIIDEVHMLSRSAFNALLKILEEPPDHVMFVFATTEIEQVPDTILSRCQRFDFRLIPARDIVGTLEEICDNEGIPAEAEALYLIARFAEGSLRDAQSLLDQMINLIDDEQSTLTERLVSETWGIASYDRLLLLLNGLAERDARRVLDELGTHLDEGNDLLALIADLADLIRSLLLLREDAREEQLRETLPDELIPDLRSLADDFTRTELTWTFDELIDLHQKLRRNTRFQRELAEVELVRIVGGRPRYDLGEIVDRLEALEGDGLRGDSTPTPGSGQSTPEPSPEDPSDSSAETTAPSNSPSGADAAERGGEPSSPAVDPGEAPTPENAPRPEPTAPASPPAPGTTGTDPEEGEELDEGVWEQVHGQLPNPAQAYLRNCRRVRRFDEELVCEFDAEYENHVERLRQQKFTDQVREVVEDVVGTRLAITFQLRESSSESTDEPDGEESSGQDAREFVEQSRRIFEDE